MVRFLSSGRDLSEVPCPKRHPVPEALDAYNFLLNDRAGDH